MYSAFMQNLVMSVLFVVMLQERKTAKGQSVYIGISKMIGTVFATILFHIRYPGSFLLHFLFLMIFIFDVIYIVMIYIVIRKKGMNPFAIL
jgi:preprotein translocase subunit SecG